MSNWKSLYKILKDAGVPFREADRPNRVHVAKNELTPEVRKAAEDAGYRTARVYNNKMVQRPAYIQQDVDAVQLTPADKTMFEQRGRNDMLTAPYEKRQLEPDSLAFGLARAITRAEQDGEIRRPTKPRKATDEELYVLEGDIQGGGAGVAPMKLSQRFSTDQEFREDALNRIYHTLKASGANKDAEALLKNVKARYNIDFVPSAESPLQFGESMGIDEIIPFKRPGFIGDDNTYYMTKTHNTLEPDVRVSKYPISNFAGGWSNISPERLAAHNKLYARSKQLINELPEPSELERLTDYDEIAKHKWYGIDNGYNSVPAGYISEDGHYYVSMDDMALPNIHYRVMRGVPQWLKPDGGKLSPYVENDYEKYFKNKH